MLSMVSLSASFICLHLTKTSLLFLVLFFSFKFLFRMYSRLACIHALSEWHMHFYCSVLCLHVLFEIPYLAVYASHDICWQLWFIGFRRCTCGLWLMSVGTECQFLNFSDLYFRFPCHFYPNMRCSFTSVCLWFGRCGCWIRPLKNGEMLQT